MIPPFFTWSFSKARAAVVPGAPARSSPISSRISATLSPMAGVGAKERSMIPNGTLSRREASLATNWPTRVILKAVRLMVSQSTSKLSPFTCSNAYFTTPGPLTPTLTTASASSESSVSSPCVNETVSDVVGAVNTAGDALEHNPKKINYGSNGKFYFETKSGRVFCGNQYIGTTSVNGIGKLITTYVGKIDIALKVYDIGATYYDEGLEDGNKKLATSVGGEAGAWLGRLAFAELGVKFGSAVGVWAGPAGPAIGGVIGGIIGAVGGEAVGSFLVEIAIE